LRVLERDNRNATPDEKRILAKYTGWGGVKEALNNIKGDAVIEHDKGSETYHYDPSWAKRYGKVYRELRETMT
jgi:hypothetical protein